MAMPADLGLVALGGGLGASLRFGATALAIKLLGKSFAWGTLAVNLAGCFAIGLMLAGDRADALWGHARPLLGIGVLGGLTTFSTFGLETFSYLEAGRWGLALLNAAANLLLGVACVAAGVALGRTFWPAP